MVLFFRTKILTTTKNLPLSFQVRCNDVVTERSLSPNSEPEYIYFYILKTLLCKLLLFVFKTVEYLKIIKEIKLLYG